MKNDLFFISIISSDFERYISFENISFEIFICLITFGTVAKTSCKKNHYTLILNNDPKIIKDIYMKFQRNISFFFAKIDGSANMIEISMWRNLINNCCQYFLVKVFDKSFFSSKQMYNFVNRN